MRIIAEGSMASSYQASSVRVIDQVVTKTEPVAANS